jgi:hypothetical protein
MGNDAHNYITARYLKISIVGQVNHNYTIAQLGVNTLSTSVPTGSTSFSVEAPAAAKVTSA